MPHPEPRCFDTDWAHTAGMPLNAVQQDKLPQSCPQALASLGMMPACCTELNGAFQPPKGSFHLSFPAVVPTALSHQSQAPGGTSRLQVGVEKAIHCITCFCWASGSGLSGEGGWDLSLHMQSKPFPEYVCQVHSFGHSQGQLWMLCPRFKALCR